MINEKFFNLPEEKQTNIINASIYVFSKNDFRHASTDDIAARASISKGLLFHYFINKKTLFSYTYKYSMELLYNTMVDSDIWKITDFIELCKVSGCMKLDMTKKYPYIFEFIMRAYYDTNPDIKGIVGKYNNYMMNDVSKEMLKNIDYSKFKDGIDLSMVINIIFWTGEGFLKNREDRIVEDYDSINDEYKKYIDMFKICFYKEEYL